MTRYLLAGSYLLSVVACSTFAADGKVTEPCPGMYCESVTVAGVKLSLCGSKADVQREIGELRKAGAIKE